MKPGWIRLYSKWTAKSVAVCEWDLFSSLFYVRPVAPAETRSWHKNCITQTTSWSPCSRTCGRGLSLRVSNANDQCELVKESRLCNLRPCEVDITKHIKVVISSEILKRWMLKKYSRLYTCLLHSSISQERNVWTSTEKSCPQTSPSLAAPARSCTSPSTVASARTSAAAYRTSPKPSTLSLSVLMGRDSRGRWCGSRPASATSAAKTPTTSLPTWRITTDSQKLSTSCHFCSQPVGTSVFFFWLLPLQCFFFWCMIMYKGYFVAFFPIGKIC